MSNDRMTPELEKFADDFSQLLAKKAGRKYAEQESGSLAGMAPEPDFPNVDLRYHRQFWEGYREWREEQERTP